jgi:tetratricopeptide (TPR) repeat protein
MARLRNDAALMGREEIADLFNKAIALDPGFALAHAGRAFWEYWLHIEGQRNADFDLAFLHAEKAIACDPREAFGHHTLGALHFISGNRASALAGFQRAIELNPSFAWTYHLLGMTELRLEQYEEADALISTAIRISPRDTLIGIFLAGRSLISFCRK